MDATQIIAVWGAITGSGSLVVLFRDKPRLVASQEFEISRAGKDSTVRIVLHIVNNGRQPVTVFRAGFGTRSRRSRMPPWRVTNVSALRDTQGPTLPQRLEAGEPMRLTLDLIRPNQIYKPDSIPRGFAMDTRRKTAWAKPRFSEDDWKVIYEEFDWSTKKGTPAKAP